MFASVFALVVFAAALLYVGSIYRQRTGSPDFHLSGRNVGALTLAASTFTLIGGGEFVTLTALSIVYGYGVGFFFGGVGAGFVAFGLLAHRARIRGLADDMHSLPDYFASYFGRTTAITATSLSLLSLGALLLIQLVVGGMMLNISTELPVWVCTVGMATVVCLYVYLGGINGVFATDIVQAIMMIGVVIILAVAYSGPVADNTPIEISHSTIPWGDALALSLGGFFAVLAGADVWQRVLAGRSDSAVRKGLMINAVGWVAFGAFIMLIAFKVQHAIPDVDPNAAFFELLQSGLPTWLAAMTTLLLFSALLSTADTELFVVSVLLNKELSRGKGEELSVKRTKLYVVMITVIACVLALFLTQLVDIYFFLLYFMMILGPVALARLLGRGRAAFALTGILAGVAILIYLFIADMLVGPYPLLIMVPSCVTFLTKGQEVGKA